MICSTLFFDGYCSTVQGLLDWFEVDLGFTELSLIQIDYIFCRICHTLCMICHTFCMICSTFCIMWYTSCKICCTFCMMYYILWCMSHTLYDMWYIWYPMLYILCMICHTNFSRCFTHSSRLLTWPVCVLFLIVSVRCVAVFVSMLQCAAVCCRVTFPMKQHQQGSYDIY